MSHRLATRILGLSRSANSRAEPEPGQLSATPHDGFVALGSLWVPAEYNASVSLPSSPCEGPGAPSLRESTKRLTRRKGMMLSLAMACNRRGAPVRLCRPAPQVEKKDPMTMTQGEGQANVPTTRFLLTPSPYLQGPGLGHATCKEPPSPGWGCQSQGCQGLGRVAMVGRTLVPRH